MSGYLLEIILFFPKKKTILKDRHQLSPTQGLTHKGKITLNASEFDQVSKNHDAGRELMVMGLFPL